MFYVEDLYMNMEIIWNIFVSYKLSYVNMFSKGKEIQYLIKFSKLKFTCTFVLCVLNIYIDTNGTIWTRYILVHIVY